MCRQYQRGLLPLVSPVLARLPACWALAASSHVQMHSAPGSLLPACALPASLPACNPNGLTDCSPLAPLLNCRTYFPSTRSCKQFGYSGWSEVATVGVVSGITRPSGLLPQATATGCSGGFCSFVPQSAVIRQVLGCRASTVPSHPVCLSPGLPASQPACLPAALPACPISEPLLPITSSPPAPAAAAPMHLTGCQLS